MRGLHDRSWPWQQNPPSGGRTPIVIRFKHQPPKRPATSTVREILHAHRFIGDSEPTLILVGQSSPFYDSVNGSVFIWEPTFDQCLPQLKTSIGVGANERCSFGANTADLPSMTLCRGTTVSSGSGNRNADVRRW